MAKAEIYRDGDGDWRWRLIARNGRIVATSGEGYVNLSHAKRMARRLFPCTKQVVVN